jgi:cell division protein FtsI (penicillin-binding protein 3)
MTVADIVSRPFWPVGRWVFRRLQWIEHGYERARAKDDAETNTRLRIFFVLVLFGAGFVVLGLGATRAALFSPWGHGVEIAAPSPNARGELTDRNGQVLALDVPRYGLYIDPREMAFPAQVEAALLKALPGSNLTPAKIERLLGTGQQQYLIGNLTPETRDAIHDLALPGVSFEEETGRDYPMQTFAAHLIGYSRDGNGIAGAERAFNGALRADGGTNSVALSIDLRVQAALENELHQAVLDMSPDDAVGMVVNVRTGEILAMASEPTFNPNQVTGFDRNTMTNRAAGQVYEPGSVMKIFTLAMGIDAGVATPDTKFDVGQPLVLPGQIIHDFDHGPSTLTLREVFTHSSNIGAAKLGLMAGAQTLDRYFRGFGLFNAAPSELIESTHPILPAKLTDNTVASMSFGHAIAVSPLQLATGIASIVDGGIYRPLTLRPLAPGQQPAPGRRVISETTSATMLALLRDNVVGGTGQAANEVGLRVGGKTGTATKLVQGHYAEGRNVANLASFAAVFPTDGPLTADRYLVLIMLDAPKPTAADHGVTTAALTAAPTAGRVIDRIASFVGVRRVITASDLAPKPTPTAASMGANER